MSQDKVLIISTSIEVYVHVKIVDLFFKNYTIRPCSWLLLFISLLLLSRNISQLKRIYNRTRSFSDTNLWWKYKFDIEAKDQSHIEVMDDCETISLNDTFICPIWYDYVKNMWPEHLAMEKTLWIWQWVANSHTTSSITACQCCT